MCVYIAFQAYVLYVDMRVSVSFFYYFMYMYTVVCVYVFVLLCLTLYKSPILAMRHMVSSDCVSFKYLSALLNTGQLADRQHDPYYLKPVRLRTSSSSAHTHIVHVTCVYVEE